MNLVLLVLVLVVLVQMNLVLLVQIVHRMRYVQHMVQTVLEIG